MLPPQRYERQHTAKKTTKKTSWGSITAGRKAPGHKAAKIQSRNIGRSDNAAAFVVWGHSAPCSVISTVNAAPLKTTEEEGEEEMQGVTDSLAGAKETSGHSSSTVFRIGWNI